MQQINYYKQMCLRCRPFWWPCGGVEAIHVALSDDGCPGLLRKPLDAVIRRLLAPWYRPADARVTGETTTMGKHPVCWPFQWPWQCAGTIPRASPDRGGSELGQKPLNATIGQVLRPIVAQWRQKKRFFLFHRHSLQKGSRWCQGS